MSPLSLTGSLLAPSLLDVGSHTLPACLMASRWRSWGEDSTHGHHHMVNTEIRLIIFFAAKDGDALYNQQKQDGELTMAQIMNSLLPNSDLNIEESGENH